MTPDTEAAAWADLGRAAQVLTGAPLSTGRRERFARYLDLLRLWSRAQRLVGPTEPAAIVRGFFVDSLLFLPLLPPRPARLVDIGAGAGFPGIPLAIADPALVVTLVEAREKRVSFLRTVVRELGLGSTVAVAAGRAEVLREGLVAAGPYDVAVARAAGRFDTLAATALGYLKPGGRFIAAGPPAGEPVDADASARWQVREYPELGLRRAFLVATRGVDE